MAGETDKVKGRAKESIGHVKDKVDEVVEKARHKMKRAIDETAPPSQK